MGRNCVNRLKGRGFEGGVSGHGSDRRYMQVKLVLVSSILQDEIFKLFDIQRQAELILYPSCQFLAM